MNFKPRTWFLLSIVLFIAAWFFWQRGEEWRSAQPHRSGTNSSTASIPTAVTKGKTMAAPVLFPKNLVVSGTATNLAHPASPSDYRVSNTAESFEALAVKESAILLHNAWIDTAVAQPVPIPAELRAAQDPESYIVQSKGVITPAFRKDISEAGATVISYIPNNAYLVRVGSDGAEKLTKSPRVQAVLPNEPLYRIDMGLMPEALGQRRNPGGKALRVTAFPGQRDAAMAAMTDLGGTVVGQDNTPFGPQLIVQVPLTSNNTVQQLAQMSFVQGIELYQERIRMNDITRVRTTVSVNTVTNGSYLGLTGTNILVNVNDSGTYADHPDLSNRVFGVVVTNQLGVIIKDTRLDPDGHGTHVSGIIMSSGSNSPSGLILTNFGSVSNANFRGMAPAASVFVLPFDLNFADGLNSFGSDAALAELAARSNMFNFGRTNTLISNNSWGYGSRSYNSSAAIFDGAARDALPDVPGSQPVLFIFAAGNRGGAGDLCYPQETADSINSPATMKNGIAVGAIESLRKIGTNTVLKYGKDDLYYTCNNCDFLTNNLAFNDMTDSSNQVAGFSSRGNTGINSKSIGRFKPDLVAPGVFEVSTRPIGTNWAESSYYNPTNVLDGYTFLNLTIKAGATNHFPPLIVPDNTVEIRLRAISTVPVGEPLVIFASTSSVPASAAGSFSDTNFLSIPNPSTNCDGDIWNVDVVNKTTNELVYNFHALVLVTNKGSILTVMSNLNVALDTNKLYRMETGTSMAAPVVSGLAALMQEFFEQRLGRTNSPALMKALLINGARSVSSGYHLQTDPLINQQGWGLVNIQNTIPALLNTLSNTTDEVHWPIRFFDENLTNTLATGQSHTYGVGISNNLALQAPLRVTLVWTDPPGNPAATINLVNDLDLIVTNNETGEVYFGNNFTGSGDFSEINLLTSNSIPISYTGVTNDFINNVENVYINGPLGSNYSICVVGKRVNVNAVIANTNDIVQDYALVISSGNTSALDAFTVAPRVLTVDTNPAVTYLDIGSTDSTNAITGNQSRGTVVEAQHVGANPSVLASINGTNLQWRFYAVTNSTSFTNVVFSVFSAPTLSVARNISDPDAVSELLGPNSRQPLGRNISADLDLYVSTDSGLTNLEGGAVSGAAKSLGRLSDETIISGTTPGDVFYIGVKSEDQQGGEFSLGVVFLSAYPYGFNSDGSVTMELPFANYNIADGSADSPGGAVSLPLPGPPNFEVAAVVVEDQFTHDRFSDLTGILQHDSKAVYLNNHNASLFPYFGTISNTYDDIKILTNAPPNLIPSDGPGDLTDYLGDKGSGMWRFFMIDNALGPINDPPGVTGRVDGVVLTLFPQFTNGTGNATSGRLFSGVLNPGQTRYGALTIPPTAVSLTLKVSIPNAGEGPLELYVRRDNGTSPRLPGPSNFEYMKTILAPGDSLTIGRGDIPPLMAGRYIIALRCPPSSPQTTFDAFFDIKLDLGETAPDANVDTNIVVVADQVFTNSSAAAIHINLATNRLVSDVRVGVRIDHPRISDLSLHLVGPSEKSVLLSENRGNLTTNGMGYGTNFGEFAYASFSEDTNSVIPIKFASSPHFLEFINPLLLATNVMGDNLAVNPVTIAKSSGGAAEDRNTIDTGITTGQLSITYQMFSVPDFIRVYYESNLIYDSGLVSGSNNVIVNFSGASTLVEIVMNEGNNTNFGTAWNYSVSFLSTSLVFENQRSTGIAIRGNDLFLSGITGANSESGIGARFGLPMQDNSHPIWELDYPDLGSTRFNGVAVTEEGVYMVGSSVSLTDDTTGTVEPKGIVAKFPLSHPQTNVADVYGSIWHVQTPAAPGVFPFGGNEELFAVTTTTETSNTVIYTTGIAQDNATNQGRMFLAKLDTSGTVLWVTNNPTDTSYSSGRAITTLNGAIYVAGANADSGINNASLTRFDAAGNKVWARVSAGAGEFLGITAYGGSLYTVGYAANGGVVSCLMQKWDELGNSLWTNQFTLNGSEDILRSIVAYADRVYAVGSTAVNPTNRDCVLLAANQETGTNISITTYDGGNGADDIANSIATDGFDLYVGGETHRSYTNRTDSDVLLLRYRIKDDYLPEETLSLFTGDYANGDWRLVLWDNRADQVVSQGNLLSWQLQLTLAPTNNTADVLTHDVPFISSVAPKNPIHYFIVNVPFTATRATVSLTNLTGGNLFLWFDQYGLPLPSSTTRSLLLTNVTAGAVRNIDSTSGTVPILIPGQRFYLGVEGTSTGTQDFVIQVSFDSDATTFMVAGDSSQGGFTPGFAGNNSYQFRINPSDPTMAFQLRNLTGNVEVFLQRGTTPTPTSYAFHQTLTGTNFGQILIQPQGDLTDVKGTWFASIRNVGTNAAAYTVVIATANRAPVIEGPNDRVITKGDLLTFTLPVADADLPAQQFTFGLEPGAPAGASINSSNGVFSWTPTAAQGPSSNVVTIRVTDNGVPPITSTRTFSIIVNEKVPVFAAPTVVSGKLQITWSSLTGQNYEVQTSTNLVNWTTIATNAASGATTTYLDPEPQVNKTEKFYRIHPIP